MRLNGADVLIDSVLPLRVADWEALENGGITLQTLQEEMRQSKIKQAVTLAKLVLGKMPAPIVDVGTLNRKELFDVLSAVMDAETKLNPPTSDASMNSPAPTGGGVGKLTS